MVIKEKVSPYKKKEFERSVGVMCQTIQFYLENPDRKFRVRVCVLKFRRLTAATTKILQPTTSSTASRNVQQTIRRTLTTSKQQADLFNNKQTRSRDAQQKQKMKQVSIKYRNDIPLMEDALSRWW